MAGYDTCYGHRPDLVEERRRNARRGGRAGGRGRTGSGELAEIKNAIRSVTDGVLSETLPTGPAAVALQGFNTLLRACEIERRTFDMADLMERLAQLEERADRLA